MSRARETIMGAIRDALGGGGGGRFPLPHGRAGEASPPSSGRYHRAGTRSQGELLDLFFHRVEEYKATVTRCHPARLPIVISERVLARGVGILVTPPDLPGGWMAELRRGGPKLLQDLRPDPLTISQLASAHGVLTGCALAIADTGTLVLDGGPAQGRRALTLLPDYHLCVAFRDQVVETVSEAIEILNRRSMDPPSPLTLISGPSATSDIELIRVEGVHGPRTLDVVLVADS